MTPILKVLADFCAVYVDDFRLSDLAAYDAPLYSYRMWGYLKAAIPFFNHPFEEQERLLGTADDPKLTEPKFGTTTYTTTAEYTAPFTVSLGSDFTKYELSSCFLRQKDNTGNVFLTAVPFTYDADTGDVVIEAGADSPIGEGAVLDFNFYTDGSFAENLTPEEMKILGLCFNLVWETRFDQDYLSRVSKVEDKSFFEQNRANKQNADTERYRAVLESLRQAMTTYETKTYYKQFVINNQIAF